LGWEKDAFSKSMFERFIEEARTFAARTEQQDERAAAKI